MLAVWYAGGYFLARYIIDEGMLFSDCAICSAVAAHIPQVHLGGKGSRYPEAMHYVWLYFLTTAPLVLILMFALVTEFHERVIRHKPTLFVLAGGLMLGFYTCVFGIEFGGADAIGGFAKQYYRNLIYTVAVAGAFPIMLVASIFHLTHHCIGLFRKDSKINQGG